MLQPSTFGVWLDTLWFIHRMEYHVAVKKGVHLNQLIKDVQIRYDLGETRHTTYVKQDDLMPYLEEYCSMYIGAHARRHTCVCWCTRRLSPV